MSGRNIPIRIGIDIGGSDIKFGATNLAADKLLLDELVKRPSLATEGPDRTIAQVLDGIQAVLSSSFYRSSSREQKRVIVLHFLFFDKR